MELLGHIVTEQTGVGQSDIKDPLLFLQGFLSHTLPNARGKRTEIGEKERNYYLFEIIQNQVI